MLIEPIMSLSIVVPTEVPCPSKPEMSIPSPEERFNKYLHLVDIVLSKFKCNGNLWDDDLRSAALATLWKVSQKATHVLEEDFSSYVYTSLRYGIISTICQVRKQGPKDYKLIKEKSRIALELSQILGREPTLEEVVNKMETKGGLSKQTIMNKLSHRVFSLDEELSKGKESQNHFSLMDRLFDESLSLSDQALETKDNHKKVREIVAQLPKQQREIISMHFLGEKTQREIGALYGFTHQNVNQIIKKGLDKMRKRLSMSDVRKVNKGKLSKLSPDIYPEEKKESLRVVTRKKDQWFKEASQRYSLRD